MRGELKSSGSEKSVSMWTEWPPLLLHMSIKIKLTMTTMAYNENSNRNKGKYRTTEEEKEVQRRILRSEVL
jgi:hypothetical protein